MIKPIFQTTAEIALDLTFRLQCNCVNCGANYILRYLNGISSVDTEKLEDIKTIECQECGKELGISPGDKDSK